MIVMRHALGTVSKYIWIDSGITLIDSQTRDLRPYRGTLPDPIRLGILEPGLSWVIMGQVLATTNQVNLFRPLLQKAYYLQMTKDEFPFHFLSAFYTSKYGYKMCLRIYLNGDGTGRGSHLSLFFVVMRGLSDALLKWPFNQKVNDLQTNRGIYQAFVKLFC